MGGFYILDNVATTKKKYINGWRCRFGTEFQTSVEKVINNNWCECDNCSVIITLLDYKNLAITNGEIYNSSDIPEYTYIKSQNWTCINGHKRWASYNDIVLGNIWCPYCICLTEQLCRRIFSEKLEVSLI